MDTKQYFKKVKKWCSENLEGVDTLKAFMRVIKEQKIQMKSPSKKAYEYFILWAIEDDVLLVEAIDSKDFETGECFLLYQRNNIFVELIFPFEGDYVVKDLN